MGEAREHIMNFKVTTEEMEMIRRGAKREKMTPSEYCRMCVYMDRAIEGDPHAIKMFSENVSKFVKAIPSNIKKVIDELTAPRKETRNAMSFVSGLKSKG